MPYRIQTKETYPPLLLLFPSPPITLLITTYCHFTFNFSSYLSCQTNATPKKSYPLPQFCHTFIFSYEYLHPPLHCYPLYHTPNDLPSSGGLQQGSCLRQGSLCQLGEGAQHCIQASWIPSIYSCLSKQEGHRCW